MDGPRERVERALFREPEGVPENAMLAGLGLVLFALAAYIHVAEGGGSLVLSLVAVQFVLAGVAETLPGARERAVLRVVALMLVALIVALLVAVPGAVL
jgi:hypothetical protein